MSARTVRSCLVFTALLFLAACGETRSKRAPSFIDVTPSTVDFGTAAPGSGVTKEVTVTNTGTGPLEVTSTAIVGDAQDQFVLEGDLRKSLGPSESSVLTLHYQPKLPGAHNARLLI